MINSKKIILSIVLFAATTTATYAACRYAGYVCTETRCVGIWVCPKVP